MQLRTEEANWVPLEGHVEKAMTPHSSTLAWKSPWTEEPGRLQSMESQRVGHDWATSLSLFTFMHWRRKWQPTPVFLPGESQGQEPGGLPSMGSHRVGHDWCDLAAEGHRKSWDVPSWKFVFPSRIIWQLAQEEIERSTSTYKCGLLQPCWN